MLVHIGHAVGVPEVEFKTEAQSKTEASAEFHVQEFLLVVAIPFFGVTRVPLFEKVDIEGGARFHEEAVGKVEACHGGNRDGHADGHVVIDIVAAVGAVASVVITVGKYCDVQHQAKSCMEADAGIESDQGVEGQLRVRCAVVAKVGSIFTLEDNGTFGEAGAEHVGAVDCCGCAGKCHQENGESDNFFHFNNILK